MEKRIFKGFLKDRKQKFTKERAAILQKALSYQGHFDAESLYLKIREEGLKISRASVYRTLSLLQECGLIEKVRKAESGTVYEHTFGHKHHDHMLCIGCGAILEFYSEHIEQLQEEICKKKGFLGKSHTLEIRGYCKRCQTKK